MVKLYLYKNSKLLLLIRKGLQLGRLSIEKFKEFVWLKELHFNDGTSFSMTKQITNIGDSAKYEMNLNNYLER